MSISGVSNYSQVGVGQNLKFAKGGVNLQTDGSTTFTFAQSNGSTPALLTSGSVNANTALSTFSINGDTTLSRAASGVFQFNGSNAVVMPSGVTGTRPTGIAGMLRYNTSGTMEYYNGSAWTTLATGGTAVTAVSVATANGLAGTSSGGTTPVLTLSTTITGILQGDGTAISAATTTGTGAVVLANSPTLVTPALGTPSSVVLSNATGLPLTSGVSGVLPAANGGTGVANSNTITLGGNISTNGALTTGGTFTTGSTFSTTGAFSTSSAFTTTGTGGRNEKQSN